MQKNMKYNKWDIRYSELKDFLSNNDGEYPKVESAKDFNEKTLGIWIRTQKVEYKKGKLSADKVRELEYIYIIGRKC
jgi:hypothetical protein